MGGGTRSLPTADDDSPDSYWRGLKHCYHWNDFCFKFNSNGVCAVFCFCVSVLKAFTVSLSPPHPPPPVLCFLFILFLLFLFVAVLARTKQL